MKKLVALFAIVTGLVSVLGLSSAHAGLPICTVSGPRTTVAQRAVLSEDQRYLARITVTRATYICDNTSSPRLIVDIQLNAVDNSRLPNGGYINASLQAFDAKYNLVHSNETIYFVHSSYPLPDNSKTILLQIDGLNFSYIDIKLP